MDGSPVGLRMNGPLPMPTGFPLEARQICCDPVPLIQSDSLTLRYGSRLAFRHVHFFANRGCITAIVGPSGSGKSSFLMCLNRLTDLIPTCHVSGRLTIGNLDVLSPRTDTLQLRRHVGMIFQKPNPFPLTIRKNLEFPLREQGVGHQDQRLHLIETSLQQVGLWDEVKDRLDRPALALSGGQQQRLCIARALALSPNILLFDEPCSALDPISSGTVEDLISGLHGSYTVIIVTHNLAQARRIADDAAFFWVQDGAGELIEQGSTRQIFEHPQHELTAAYIQGVRG